MRQPLENVSRFDRHSESILKRHIPKCATTELRMGMLVHIWM